MPQTADKRTRPPRPGDSLAAARLCAAAALAKSAHDLLLLDVAALAGYADYFILASGRSTRQAGAIAENVARVMKKAGVKYLGLDGLSEGRWAVLDFGDVVVHVFHQPVRELYDLESLWGDAPRVEINEAELAALLPAGEES